MYFVCYSWHAQNAGPVFMNVLLKDEHPLAWLARTRKADPKAHIRLVSWQELTADEAELAGAAEWDV